MDLKVLGKASYRTKEHGVLKADEAGNYLAGYFAGYSGSLEMYLGVRAGGVLYSASDYLWSRSDSSIPHEDFWDQDSAPAIKMGREDGKADLKKFHPWASKFNPFF